MPNRGELPIPAMRTKPRTVANSAAGPDAEAWTIIAFCTMGWLMTFYFALSSAGADSFSSLAAQVPWG